MNKTGDSCGLLFSMSSGFAVADYLGFLAQNVPKGIAEQLFRDGQPDIGMPSQTLHADDLVRPLTDREFPSEKLPEIAGLMGYIVIGHEVRLNEKESHDDPYKMIYAASVYLYCFLRGGGMPIASGYLSAIRVMATVSSTLDLQSRLQACRFLASLVPMIQVGSTDEDAPLSSLSIALSLIVGSIIRDLSCFAAHAMKTERIDQAWSKTPDWIDSQETADAWETIYQQISALKQSLLALYGEAGDVRHAADRLLLAVAEKE